MAEQQKLESDMEKYWLYSNRETISAWICSYLCQLRVSVENNMPCVFTSKQITKKINLCCLTNPLHERITSYHPLWA